MSKLIMQKSGPLYGSVQINGAKNSVLKLMAASILASKQCIITSVPDLLDVEYMTRLLESVGLIVDFDKDKGELTITPKDDASYNIEAPYDIVSKFRASIVIMGPLLAKCGKARVPMPGGCVIGSRPIDLHIKGFRALGATVSLDHGFVDASAPNGLKGADIYLDFPSVGATENIMMAAVFANGVTNIQNAAKEPEIVDLANYLNKLGANIKGAGTETIKITGVQSLGGTTHTTVPDRLIAATYMIATAITGGEVRIENCVPSHLRSITAKLKEMGVVIEDEDDTVIVKSSGYKSLTAIDITSLPYPGLPTDIQAPFMALLTVAKGVSMVNETVFENRFMHVAEFNRMGANVKIEGHTAVVTGVDHLNGTSVKSTDLRCGAALVICGLVAEGETQINDIYHIDRGYPSIELDLKKLGAKIERCEASA